MRIFWAVIIGVVIAAIVLVVAPDASVPGPAAAPTSSTPPPPVAPVDVVGTSEDEPPTTWILKEGETLAAIAEMRTAAHHWPRIVQANPKLAKGELELGDEIVLPDLADIPLQDASALVADLDRGRSERGDEETTDRIPVPADAPRLELGLDREIPEATVTPGTIVRVDDELVADGRFRIPGEGTEASPYRVTWELLSSAAVGYRPSLGERDIPQRIALLDGAWVEIEGYIAFPLGGADTTELLAMLNQWDGCCIGIPPTPYDAIEVALTEAVAPAARHAISYGTLTGRLVVSPYLVENWLVGLYLMDDATVRLEL